MDNDNTATATSHEKALVCFYIAALSSLLVAGATLKEAVQYS